MKRAIVTADDFGLALPVNEAVERAHRDGILGAASLMVAGPAVTDAVERARRLPGLRVGLHLVVTRGRPVLPPAEIPALVGGDGRLARNLVGAGVRYAFSGVARRDLGREIRAQFRAFAETGLALDHADVHNHLHLHPVVFDLVAEIGRDFGLPAIRLPFEPFRVARRMSPAAAGAGRALGALALWPWAAVLKRRLRRCGYRCNDYLFGWTDSGRMDAGKLARILRGLPEGLSEIHLHPATGPWDDPDAEAHPERRRAEFEALLDADVRRAAQEAGVVFTTFGVLAAPAAA